MPFRKLFLSRWSALLWAAGVLWFAFDTVGSGPHASRAAATATNETDATGDAVNSADLALLANAMKGD